VVGEKERVAIARSGKGEERAASKGRAGREGDQVHLTGAKWNVPISSGLNGVPDGEKKNAQVACTMTQRPGESRGGNGAVITAEEATWKAPSGRNEGCRRYRWVANDTRARNKWGKAQNADGSQNGETRKKGKALLDYWGGPIRREAYKRDHRKRRG